MQVVRTSTDSVPHNLRASIGHLLAIARNDPLATADDLAVEPAGTLLLAVVPDAQGAPAAVASLRYYPCGYINFVATAPEHRRKGYSSQLFQHLFGHVTAPTPHVQLDTACEHCANCEPHLCTQCSSTRTWILDVLTDNAAAVGLYVGVGFVHVGDIATCDITCSGICKYERAVSLE